MKKLKSFLKKAALKAASFFSINTIGPILYAGAAFAFAAPAAGDPFFPAWHFLTGTVVGGALGATIAVGGMGYGLYQFVKHPEAGMLGTLGAGGGIACIGALPTIVAGLGMVI